MSFTIPIDAAANFKHQLIAYGKVTRGRLGIEIQDVTQALADSFELKQTDGALVSKVEQDSPAARAGIKTGDVIVKFDGKVITLSSELPFLVPATKPGASATLGGAQRFKPQHRGEGRRNEGPEPRSCEIRYQGRRY